MNYRRLAVEALKTYAGADDVQVVDVHGVQITLALHKERTIGEEGHLLMDVERFLQNSIGAPIEVYFRQRQDQNKLRQNRTRMKDWLRRRALAKIKAKARQSQEIIQ